MARGVHILIVEDKPIVLDIIQAILATEYRVSSVSTVEEAYAILRTSHIDLVLIDAFHPDGRGADLAVFAEKVGAAVIEMTGDPLEHNGLIASGRQHLFKPLVANVLLATVGDVLMSARAISREITALPS